jgi:flagellar hook-basal body complex protein FliE
MIDKVSSSAVQSMLSQIRAYEARAKGQPELLESGSGVEKTSFSELVKGAVNSVNDLQQESSVMAAAYESGDDVPLTDVVLSMQKSSIAFEATLQIRNKVIKAYEDIKNMPV